MNKGAGDTRIVRVEETTSVTGPAVEKPAVEVDQQAMVAVDAAIAEAVEVMSATREQIAKTLNSRNPSAFGEEGSSNSPVAMVAGSRRRILDQMSASRAAMDSGHAQIDDLLRLNSQLLERISSLTREMEAGTMPARLYLVELRTEVGNYLDRVDSVLSNRVTVQLS
jgi:hypothetical protein